MKKDKQADHYHHEGDEHGKEIAPQISPCQSLVKFFEGHNSAKLLQYLQYTKYLSHRMKARVFDFESTLQHNLEGMLRRGIQKHQAQHKKEQLLRAALVGVVL